MIDISLLIEITTLALSDSVNPCVMAVLLIILMRILTKNPDQKQKILYVGIAFSLAIFIGYLFYGLIIIQVFKSFTSFMKTNTGIIFNSLAIFAMILGALNIKDFFIYKKGSFATEMPISMRPKVKKIINKICSPSGAFVLGFLLTIFLLPCTIGPYFIASGILYSLSYFEIVLWLIYYNIIFILPMLIIIGIVYFSFAKINEVSGWKERHIRMLHLIAGILLFLVGFLILIGRI